MALRRLVEAHTTCKCSQRGHIPRRHSPALLGGAQVACLQQLEGCLAARIALINVGVGTPLQVPAGHGNGEECAGIGLQGPHVDKWQLSSSVHEAAEVGHHSSAPVPVLLPYSVHPVSRDMASPGSRRTCSSGIADNTHAKPLRISATWPAGVAIACPNAATPTRLTSPRANTPISCPELAAVSFCRSSKAASCCGCCCRACRQPPQQQPAL